MYFYSANFRGNFLPSAELNRRFMSYAAFGFGLPLVMATLALGVDSAASKVAAQKLYEGTSGDSLAYEVGIFHVAPIHYNFPYIIRFS